MCVRFSKLTFFVRRPKYFSSYFLFIVAIISFLLLSIFKFLRVFFVLFCFILASVRGTSSRSFLIFICSEFPAIVTSYFSIIFFVPSKFTVFVNTYFQLGIFRYISLCLQMSVPHFLLSVSSVSRWLNLFTFVF